ncbi:hypothetical protein RIF25_04825 [Thermosynechococcaceae cyanobacterium BACA0444]|uniref:Uncharacterized protein n=1 Tax=Pseudocalidococcus azoricus BACA0444 TaxID=2918990 RepID=A0AAE4FR39_9CYAN|nr:hypothetical protein [Pseudocalidococcus azoricus]MDS3860124.1 hypothetical protein [Pseudocalidococcus azoricus BACA0444]
MLQPGDRVEFSFWEAGCMIWLGSLDVYESFCQAWFSLEDNVIKTDAAAIQDLILNQRAIMPMELYQDDGFRTRVILRELNQREQEDWTARVAGQLNLPTGQMVVSGIVDRNQEVPALADIDPEDGLQLYVNVTPGEYAVTVYAYPPGDLSTGWGQIADPDLFKPTAGIEPENPLDYFLRTRPGEAMPDWLGAEYGATAAERDEFNQACEESPGFIDFVVQLLPLKEPLPSPWLDGEMFIPWEFRKPQRFPLGVPAQA